MNFLQTINHNKSIIIIVIISCFFIFYNLTAHDAVSDEAINAFRSIGYYDHLVSDLQTTPYQWFEQVPWWAKLSFHDAPYLSFLIQFIFFNFFGISLLVMRLPFALAGIGVLITVYYFFKKFINAKWAWLAPLLLISNVYYLWSSKIGYLEILASFFIWLSIYLFFKIKENNKNFYWWGLALGLALVTKYTAFFIIPVYFLYLLFFEREFLKDKRLYLALLITLLIFSPVIIYNLAMFETRGHFDLQFSALFGQEVEAWSKITRGVSGDITNFLSRQKDVLAILRDSWGVISFVLFGLSWLFLLVKSFISKNKINSFFVIMALVYLLLFSLIGGSYRFLSFFNPLWAVLITLTFLQLKTKKIIFYILFIILIGYNLLINFNTLVLAGSLNQNKLLFSQSLVLRSYGYDQLAKEMNEIIKQEMPMIGKEKNNTLFIFDSNINYFSKIWYIQRLVSYELIPFASTNEILEVFKREGFDYYYQQGFDKFYFIKATPNTKLVPESARSETANILEKNLLEEGQHVYRQIENTSGQVTFIIYKF